MSVNNDPINLAFALLKKRANQRGATGNISPDTFNRFFPQSEFRFFNREFKVYAATQVISDSISKWMSDPQYLLIDGSGRFNFYDGMNLMHVDSMNTYLPATGTGQINYYSITPGTGYTNGTYNVSLTGGAGVGATATVTVSGGVVTYVLITNPGTIYTNSDVLTAAIPAGTGWSITVTGIAETTPQQVKRVEKSYLAANLSSTYDSPSNDFPIYTQYSTWFQFYPLQLGMAQVVFLKQPTFSYWNYNLQGYIATLTGLVGGTLYTNGTYTNVPLTGGLGNGALATVVVSGAAVTSVTISNPGKLYAVNDVLSASAANIGGTGSGFNITVSSLVSGTERAIYTASGSVQPLWNEYDLSTIVDMCLIDISIANRDAELMEFSQTSTQRPE